MKALTVEGSERLAGHWIAVDDTGRGQVAGKLSSCALVVYLATSIVFHTSSFRMTYPDLARYGLPIVADCVVVGMSLLAMATGRMRVSRGVGCLGAVAVSVFLLSSLLINDYRLYVALMLLLALSSGDVGFRRATRIYYLTVMASLVAVMFLSFAGILWIRDVMLDGRLVFGYGIQHPNTIGSILISAIAAVAYDLWYERKWWLSLAMSVIAAIFCYVVQSSSASLVVFVGLTAIIVVGHSPLVTVVARVPRRVRVAMLLVIPLVLCVGMMLLSVVYDAENPLMAGISELLHGRPKYAGDYYTKYGGFSLFGRTYISTIEYHAGLPFDRLDCVYCQLAMVYGLATLLVMAVTYTAVVRRVLSRPGEFVLPGFALVMCAYAVMEVLPMYLYTNFLYFAVIELLRESAVVCRSDGAARRGNSRTSLRRPMNIGASQAEHSFTTKGA